MIDGIDPDKLAMLLTSREIVVPIDAGTEHRLRLHIDRVNRALRADGAEEWDPDVDEDLGDVIGCLVFRALDASEAEAGLSATVFGDVMSREVRDEQLRRFRRSAEGGEQA